MPADPIPPTVAERWRPMWHMDAFVPRPWWRAVDDVPSAYVRVDGWRVERVLGVIFATPPRGAFAELPGNPFLPDGLAHVDATSPLPAPEPMPGQVWVSGGGTACMIAAAWRHGDSWWVQWASNDREPKLWAPSTASVLVSGPTPWGRDVPWAPMGGGAS